MMKKAIFVVMLFVLLIGCAPVVPPTATVVPPTQTPVVPPTATVVPTPSLLMLSTEFPTDGRYKETLKITEDDITNGIWQRSVDNLNQEMTKQSANIVTVDWRAAKLVGINDGSFMYAIGIFVDDRKKLFGSYSSDEKILHWPVQPEIGYSWIEEYHGRGDVIVFPVRFYNQDGTSVSVPMLVDAGLLQNDMKKYWSDYVETSFLKGNKSGHTSVVLGYKEAGKDAFGLTAVGIEDVGMWQKVLVQVKESKIIPSEAGFVGWPHFIDKLR